MVLAAGKRFAPVVPWTLVVLVAAIAASALLDLEDHGVAVVGDLPSALPDPALPGRLWLTGVRVPEVELLERSGLAGRVHVAPRIDAALQASRA